MGRITPDKRNWREKISSQEEGNSSYVTSSFWSEEERIVTSNCRVSKGVRSRDGRFQVAALRLRVKGQAMIIDVIALVVAEM